LETQQPTIVSFGFIRRLLWLSLVYKV